MRVDFSIHEISLRSEPQKVLICSPDYFDIVDEKNIHMKGNVGVLNKKTATGQWSELKSVYDRLVDENILEEVLVIDGQPGLEDMVFCANQSFPWIVEGEKTALLSNMRHDSRQREVEFFDLFYKKQGYKTVNLASSGKLEGMGDMIPHPGKQLIYGGHGYRTDAAVYDEIVGILKTPIVKLKLIDDRFYHLDTCFLPIDEQCVLLCREAFEEESYAAITKMFATVIEIPAGEAESTFSLNAHLIQDEKSGRRVAVIQRGSEVTKRELERLGIEVIEIETSEFMKSGGSVFCMKMMVY